ncbi:MAG: hypothetical protein AAGH15_03805 [Myxococcota bacterium]
MGGTTRGARALLGLFLVMAVACGSDEGTVGPLCRSNFLGCDTNADCCAWGDRDAFCVEGVCVPRCESQSDCATISGCCAETSASNVNVCWIASACGSPVPDGDACTRNDDCFGFETGTSECVLNGTFGDALGECVARCAANDECLSGCCAPTDADTLVCSPPGFCGLCNFDGEACMEDTECCSFGSPNAPGLCVFDADATVGECTPFCVRDGDCPSGCCAPLNDGRTVCSPPVFCDDSSGLCSNTCEFANDGECDDGGAGAMFDVCELGTDCNDCGPR